MGFGELQTAFEAVGVSVRRGMGVAPFDEVLTDLANKWDTLALEQKQSIANAIIRYLVE